jgi:hypothetical protein
MSQISLIIQLAGHLKRNLLLDPNPPSNGPFLSYRKQPD